MSLSRPVHPASACYPGYTHLEAMELLSRGASEPGLGELSLAQAQLCPQNRSALSAESCAQLRQAHPEVAFRAHANVNCAGRFGLHDASSSWAESSFLAWKRELKAVCEALSAPAYSWHAGRSGNATLEQARDRTLDLEQELGIPVALEGLYPSRSESWLMSSFEDYAWALNQPMGLAIDLSHWQIVARAEGRQELGLLEELLRSERCLEVHLSDNDGRRDEHKKLERAPFWFDLVERLCARGQIQGVLFTEGLQHCKPRAER